VTVRKLKYYTNSLMHCTMYRSIVLSCVVYYYIVFTL